MATPLGKRVEWLAVGGEPEADTDPQGRQYSKEVAWVGERLVRPRRPPETLTPSTARPPVPLRPRSHPARHPELTSARCVPAR